MVHPGGHRRPADTVRQRPQELPAHHHQHAYAVGHSAHVDTDGEPHTIAHADADPFAVGDTFFYCEADDRDPHLDADAYPHANADAYPYADADPYSDPNSDSHANTDRYADRHLLTITDSFADTDADGYADRHPLAITDSFADADADGYADRHPLADTDPITNLIADGDTHRYTDRHPITDPFSYAFTHSRGVDGNPASYVDADADPDTRRRIADAVSDSVGRQPSTDYGWPRERRLAQLGIDRALVLPHGLRLRLLEVLPLPQVTPPVS